MAQYSYFDDTSASTAGKQDWSLLQTRTARLCFLEVHTPRLHRPASLHEFVCINNRCMGLHAYWTLAHRTYSLLDKNIQD
jgi:hypothetical protein